MPQWRVVGGGGVLPNYGCTWVKGVLGSHGVKISYRTKCTGVYVWIYLGVLSTE